MSTTLTQIYYDRAEGVPKKEPVYASRFLDWSYNSRSGRLLMDAIFRRRWVSRVYGWLQRTRWSRHRIRPFVEKMGVDTEEIARPLDEFGSFRDFFVRRIDLSRRRIRTEPEVCIAPADGRVLVYPQVERGQTFSIKRSTFNLQRLLRDDELAAQYEGGAVFITRLYLSDYHHFHFPDDGVPHAARSIDGGLHAVSPYARRREVPIYSENHRMVSRFLSESFGRIVFVEIGALTVGSIQQCYEAERQVERAQHKGFFDLGGSTVVLIFEPGRIQFDEDLVAQTRRKMETYVKLGDSIGRRPGA